MFACQHKTRETVWIPELMKHANGAQRLKQVLIASPKPAKDAAHLVRMIDGSARTEPDGAFAVPRVRTAPILCFSRGSNGEALSGSSFAGLPERGSAGLVIGRPILRRRRRRPGAQAVRSDRAVCVPPSAANGTMLAFVGA